MAITEILVVLLGLSLFEIISSVDNAIINAHVLKTLPEKYKKFFLFWGLLIAVVAVRGLLPFFIVWLANPAFSFLQVITFVFHPTPEIDAYVERSQAVLLLAGGVYLFFVFLGWLFLEEKKYAFLVEEFVHKQSVWFYAVSSLFIMAVVYFSIRVNPILALSAVIGSTAFFITDGFKKNAEENAVSTGETHGDCHIIRKEDDKKNISVELVREFIRILGLSSFLGEHKVGIIRDAECLSLEASNALLKTLEEPPSHAVFILATTEIHKMIPTIISRCQRFDFRKLTLPEIISRLEMVAKKEGVHIEKPALELIALSSGGAIRDAEGLLDQALTFSGTLGRTGVIKAEDLKELLGMVDVKIVSDFVGFLCEKKAGEAIQFLNGILEKGKDVQEFTKAVINYLRQGLILKIGVESSNPIIIGLTNEEQAKLQAQVAVFEEQDLRNTLKLFMDAENKMKYSSIPYETKTSSSESPFCLISFTAPFINMPVSGLFLLMRLVAT